MTTKKRLRVERANERKVISSSLTIAQRIAKLDALFGSGVGAKKERAKLALKLEKESQPKIEKNEKPESKKKS
jgi:hypothetical protein